MKDFYVRDARDRQGTEFTSFFAVASYQIRPKRIGGSYAHFLFVDRTGQIPAKLWEDVEAAATLKEGDLVKVRGQITSYQEKPEITIQKIRVATDEEVDLADFLPTTSFDVEEMWTELQGYVDAVKSVEIKGILQLLMTESEIPGLLRKAPAAKAYHHAYLGGLLEHVVSLCRLCTLVHQNYTWLNLDLLLAAAMLHDIGKVYELTYSRSIGYSDRGKLVGHISLGAQILHRAADRLEVISEETLTLLEHLILSHHGQLQYGSPVEPYFAEALLFHYLDNADSKMAAIKEMMDRHNVTPWTERVPSLGRPVLRPNEYHR